MHKDARDAGAAAEMLPHAEFRAPADARRDLPGLVGRMARAAAARDRRLGAALRRLAQDHDDLSQVVLARLHARYGRGRPRAGVVVGSAAALVAMVLSNHARDPLARSKSRIETVGEDAAGYLRRMPVPGADPEAAACARSMRSMLRTLGAAVGRLAPARRRALLASLASEGPASAAARKAAGRARAHLRQALDLPSAPRRPRPRR